jgi:hypothetical protein
VTKNWGKVADTVVAQLAEKGVALAWETEVAASDFHDAAPSSATVLPAPLTAADVRRWLWSVRHVPSAGVYAYTEGDRVHMGLAFPVPA